METVPYDPQLLMELARTRMPFGKYRGRLLIDLPEPYVVWFSRQGFPPGKLGEMLGIVLEIKINGLEALFAPLRQGVPAGESVAPQGERSRNPTEDFTRNICKK